MDRSARAHELVTFRFFRLLGREIAIFAEYVAGPTLHDWIEENASPSLAAVLDLALQFARGLGVAHHAGLVHHDVKPGNVLVSAGGVAKLTDFGLARTRGMTERFCSPEQAKGLETTHATDVWSWGLSVFQMFMGEVTWSHGTAALGALEDFLLHGPSRGKPPPMPATIADLLRRCFAEDPKQRWRSFDEITAVLEKELQRIGEPVRPADRPVVKRGLSASRAWADPTPMLAWCRRATGQSDESPRPPSRSAVAAAISDLAAFEEAKEILLASTTTLTSHAAQALASISLEQALLFDAFGDVGAAGVAAADAISRTHAFLEDAPELCRAIEIRAQMILGEALRKSRRLDEASQAFTIASKLLGDASAREDKGWLFLYWARLARDRGDDLAAGTLAHDAVILWVPVVRAPDGPHSKLLDSFVEAALLAGSKFRAIGEPTRTVSLLRQVLDVFAKPPLASAPLRALHVGRIQLELAGAAGDDPSAMDGWHGRRGAAQAALAAWYDTRDHPAWAENPTDLVGVLLSSGNAQTLPLAQSLLDQLLANEERLVVLEGRADLAHRLGETLLLAANTYFAVGNDAAGISLVERALDLWTRLVYESGRPDLRGWLVSASLNRTDALARLRRKQEASRELSRAIDEVRLMASNGPDALLYLYDELEFRRRWSALAS
jgi:hypothetical protein